MCCGNNRQQRTRINAPSVRGRPGAASIQPTSAQITPAPATAETRAPVLFEYVGKTGLSVVSPTTGLRYRFDQPGAQVAVDPRDHALLLYVPNLRPLKTLAP